MLDYVVLRDSVREKILDMSKLGVITLDNVSIDVDAVIYWRILELELAYYATEDVEQAMEELVIASLRRGVEKIELDKIFSSLNQLNRTVLGLLDEATEPWGVKVTRVEVQKITLPDSQLDKNESGLAKRVALALDQANISDNVGLWVAQTGSKVVLKYNPDAAGVIEQAKQIAMDVEGATAVEAEPNS